MKKKWLHFYYTVVYDEVDMLDIIKGLIKERKDARLLAKLDKEGF